MQSIPGSHSHDNLKKPIVVCSKRTRAFLWHHGSRAKARILALMQSIRGPHSHKNLKKPIVVCSKGQELPCGTVDQKQSMDLSSNAMHSRIRFPQKHQEFNLACRKRTRAFLWHYGSRTSKDFSSNATHSRSTLPQKPQEANCSVQVKNKESSLPFLLYLQVNFAVV